MTTRSASLLRAVHAQPGITRADAARFLGVGTGATSKLIARLGQADLLSEAPATRSGLRGRPTTALLPHPQGPLVAAALITQEIWRVDLIELGGGVLDTVSVEHGGGHGPRVAAEGLARP